jgi:pimeloyl-ACP methyl ester carboxylesterase
MTIQEAGRLKSCACLVVRTYVTGPGAYGWPNNAWDVLAIVEAVGASSFAVVGQSSGAAIAMTRAQLEPARVELLIAAGGSATLHR